MAQESGSMTRDSDRSPTEIRAQIEHTRAEMSQTIDAIQARLRPGRLVSGATQSVKEATKANPVPLAIAGAAAAALVVRAVMRSRARSHRRSKRVAVPAANPPRARADRFGGNRRRIVMGTCAVGLACWGASRANIGAMMSRSFVPPSV